MIRTHFPSPRLPEGDEEHSESYVLEDAARGVRGISIVTAFLSGGVLALLLVVYDPMQYLASVGLSLLLFASAVLTIVSTLLLHRSLAAAPMVTLGSVIPFVTILALLIMSFFTPGVDWFGLAVGALLTCLYGFGLIRLRHPAIARHFWTLRAEETSSGPGITTGHAGDETAMGTSGDAVDRAGLGDKEVILVNAGEEESDDVSRRKSAPAEASG